MIQPLEPNIGIDSIPFVGHDENFPHRDLNLDITLTQFNKLEKYVTFEKLYTLIFYFQKKFWKKERYIDPGERDNEIYREEQTKEVIEVFKQKRNCITP